MKSNDILSTIPSNGIFVENKTQSHERLIQIENLGSLELVENERIAEDGIFSNHIVINFTFNG